MENPTNPYLGLSRKEIKSLRRTNKGDEAKIKLLDEAYAAALPFRAGRLKNDEMSDTAAALQAARLVLESEPDSIAHRATVEKVKNAIAILARFKVATPAAPGEQVAA